MKKKRTKPLVAPDHFDGLRLLDGMPLTLCNTEASQTGVLCWDDPNPVDFTARQSGWQDIPVAMIGSARLYHGLTSICDTLLLTRRNWQGVLQTQSPAMLLIDSFFVSHTGEWHLQQFGDDSDDPDGISAIIAGFQAAGIPVVFWNTFDVRYAADFAGLAAKCDLRFYSDQAFEGDPKTKAHYPDGYLPPACAPARQSPITPLPLDCEANGLLDRPKIGSILFDGWASYLRNKEALSWMTELPRGMLTLVDAHYQLYRNQLNSSGDMADAVLGCVTRPTLWSLWRRSDIALFSDLGLATPHSRQWDMLEAASCGAAVFIHGAPMQDDLLGDTAMAKADGAALAEAMQTTLDDPVALLQHKQRGWRQVRTRHTFAHRLQSICDRLQIAADFCPTPKVTILSATFRLDYISRILEHYQSQTYPNTELVIVVNSNAIDTGGVAAAIGDHADVRFTVVPAERVEAGSLNHGIQMATGEYIFKMDDDDIYGPHYAADMLLHATALDLDLFGKANRFFYFSDLGQTYVRNKKTIMAQIAPNALLQAHIGGATLSGKADFFRAHPYTEGNFSATDTQYYANLQGRVDGRFATLDDSGFVYWRRAPAEHSWQMDNSQLLKGMQLVADDIPRDILS